MPVRRINDAHIIFDFARKWANFDRLKWVFEHDWFNVREFKTIDIKVNVNIMVKKLFIVYVLINY